MEFLSLIHYFRGNPVVKERGDSFRDTVVLTVRGDGVDIPPFFIRHTYKNASKASGRRPEPGETPVKGMNIPLMKEYVDHVAEYVIETSLLAMDRLSSHTSNEVLAYIRSKTALDGTQLLIPILLNPKVSFLISPLDMGAIAAFKSYYRRLDRSTLPLKEKAVQDAWDAVSNESLANICLNCGVVGDEPLDSLRSRFMDEVINQVPEEYEPIMEFYDGWSSGAFKVEGADRGRGVTTEKPQELAEGHLAGKYWTKYGKPKKP
jgi:hypothetical protein